MSEFLDGKSDEFGTPDSIFLPLHEEFGFTHDLFASDTNAKLDNYFTAKLDAFRQDWAGIRGFANPPYSRGYVSAAVEKAYYETRERGKMPLCCLLIPVRTDQAWYHRLRHHFEARPIPGRIQFIGGETGARSPHMLVIFRKKSWIWTY